MLPKKLCRGLSLLYQNEHTPIRIQIEEQTEFKWFVLLNIDPRLLS